MFNLDSFLVSVLFSASCIAGAFFALYYYYLFMPDRTDFYQFHTLAIAFFVSWQCVLYGICKGAFNDYQARVAGTVVIAALSQYLWTFFVMFYFYQSFFAPVELFVGNFVADNDSNTDTSSSSSSSSYWKTSSSIAAKRTFFAVAIIVFFATCIVTFNSICILSHFLPHMKTFLSNNAAGSSGVKGLYTISDYLRIATFIVVAVATGAVVRVLFGSYNFKTTEDSSPIDFGIAPESFNDQENLTQNN